MKISHPEKTDINSITTLIFDWGGVITPISPQKAMLEFQNLGHPGIEKYFEPNIQNDLFTRLEIGAISPHQAWESLKKDFEKPVENSQLEKAYCTLLLPTPPKRIELLRRLKSYFRLFLLSNTNAVHTAFYNDLLRKDFQTDFYRLFEKPFYSHELGMRKPDRIIFEQVLHEIDIPAENILFLDDSKTNIKTARSLGMNALLIDHEYPIEKIFGDWNT